MSDLKKARELEQMRFYRLADDLNVEEQTRVAQINAEMAARGAFHSGARIQTISNIRRDKIRRVIEGRIKIRRDLCLDFPELCSEDSLKELLTEFSSTIGNGLTALHEHLAPQMAGAVGRRHGQEEYQLRAYANSEIEILKAEVALSLHRKPDPATPTVSVTTGGGSVVVNLGSIYGDVQQVVGNVEHSGYPELASLLARLASEIRSADTLRNDREGYLEQVQFIAEQATEPQERQKTSLVKGVFRGLQASLQTVANLGQILALVGPAVAQHFGFPWPL
jgi:hypothetical protein